jgi:hypothetical protein
MRITESRLRSVIKNVLKEENYGIPSDESFEDDLRKMCTDLRNVYNNTRVKGLTSKELTLAKTAEVILLELYNLYRGPGAEYDLYRPEERENAVRLVKDSLRIIEDRASNFTGGNRRPRVKN